MALLDDLIELGLPAEDDGAGGVRFTRDLLPREKQIRRALEIKYMPDDEREKVRKARPDMVDFLERLQDQLDAEPHKTKLRNKYAAAAARLAEIQAAESMTNNQLTKAVKDMAEILESLLKYTATKNRMNKGAKK